MNAITPEFISRYERIYQNDPNSTIFAPLAEAYRKDGQIEKAFNVCRRGVARHPNLASGHVAMAKVYLDMHKPAEAIDHLRKATILAPENILAHQLLADLYMEQKRPKAALRAYKMVMLHNPMDQKAKKMIQKLEELSIEEYEDDSFQMIKPSQKDSKTENDYLSRWLDKSEKPQNTAEKIKGIERILTLADAFMIRNETDKAWDLLERAQKNFGPHPEIQRKLKALSYNSENNFPAQEKAEMIKPIPPRKERIRLSKIRKLEALLHKVQQHRVY